jgi:pimeloyl-ACP methyl ester carboxylesterase
MRRRYKRRAVLAAVITIYVAVMSFGGCADKLLLHPSTDPADAGRATARFIDVNGRHVEIFTARSPASAAREPEGFVLEFCGNATRAEQITEFIADRWKSHPVEVWVMNYPGFGRSEGPATLASIPRAALATYDELKRVAGQRPVFLAGNSMGATPALYVASQRPCAGLILQNVPPLRRLILSRHGWWNLWLVALPVAMQVPVELNALDTAPRVTASAVFIIGEQDTLVPPAYQRLIVSAHAGPKQVISMRSVGHWQSLPPDAEQELAGAIDRLWHGRQAAETGARARD